MESLYILIPIAVVFLAVAIKAFLWAADNKQFDNLDQEAHRILFEEKPPVPNAPDNIVPNSNVPDNNNHQITTKNDPAA
jgi:cbb3-type cytochrome oxidase maturation protein